MSIIEIPLHSKKYPGLVALIDEVDTETVSGYRWNVDANHGNFYASAGEQHLSMHRLLMGLKRGDPNVDHIDGNGLNNTRANLRICTNAQNAANRKPRRNTSSRYKGVYWQSKTLRWYASIGITTNEGRKVFHLGAFLSEEDAALAYNAAALNHFGEFARLNDIGSQ